MQIGFVCLKKGSSGELLWTQ